jgi:enoyl-CoA hydratase/carnithine racemase
MRFVSIEQRDDVAVVRVDRPPATAMDPGLLAAWTDADTASRAAAILRGG